MFGIPWDEAKPAMARRRNKVAEIEDSDLPELSAADFPQPPADPASQDEVLRSLAERTYGH